MQHIETVVLGSAAASITFSAIPDTFTDLYLALSLRSTSNTAGTYDFVNMNLNSAGTNFTRRLLQGTGSSVASFSNTTDIQIAIINGSSSTTSTFSSHSVYLPNYASSNQKSLSVDTVHETNATAAYQQIHALLWTATTAISSFVLTLATGNFAEFSSASLYGITAGSDGIVAVS